jgi:UDP-N-acetylmuramoyl-L-alanyl-D-glutamate--2,6-diaminopimelate ligase
MRLDRLIAADLAGDDAGLQVTGLAYDSRKAGPGTLFCCVEGYRRDGHEFAAQAVENGAVALLVERPLGLNVPEVAVPSVRAAMGPLAARFYEDPTAQLKTIGITGTNGKTTTAYLVRALLQAAGTQTGLLGTVTSVIGGQERPVQRTTPEAIDLQAAFREMLDAGDEACAMEVSSHALALGRTECVSFAAAVFTNISRDHLDFHPTMDDYYRAKRLLFLPDSGPAPEIGAVNVADPYGRRLAAEIGGGAVTFAVEEPADYRATGLECDAGGCAFTLHTPAGEREIELPMPGRFNVENALGALAAVHALGHDLDTLVAALQRGVRVPGRFEPVAGAQGFTVVVDYAHTPDSLQNVLRATREIARGRVICVFGAGGDRDRGKRPLMGEIAARLADVVVVTSDNPRSEPPQAIIQEILAGIPERAAPGTTADADAGVRAVEGAVHVEVDRRRAIEWAIGTAEGDDLVLIAGKGHEQGQELADGVKLPFDDRLVAGEALRARGKRTAGLGMER